MDMGSGICKGNYMDMGMGPCMGTNMGICVVINMCIRHNTSSEKVIFFIVGFLRDELQIKTV